MASSKVKKKNIRPQPKNDEADDDYGAFSISEMDTDDKFTIIISGIINDATCVAACARLLNCARSNPTKTIYIYINSPGGYVSAAFSILSVMDLIENPIITFAMGEICSAAFILFIAGDYRYVSERAIAMSHEPSVGLSGSTSQLKIQNAAMDVVDRQIMEHISRCTGKPMKFIQKHLVHKGLDRFMIASELVSYGCADEIVKLNLRKNKDGFK
jgi:ATP-dependent Clp protease protease subunit